MRTCNCRIFLLFVFFPAMTETGRGDCTLDVDFRDAPRHLITATMQISAQPGKLSLWYPKWVPGSHSPYGPIHSLAGVRFTSDTGARVPWRRESSNPYCFLLDVPDETKQLTIEMRYIANQRTEDSDGTDSEANDLLGYFNWNTCLLYPDGCDIDRWQVKASIRLPRDWQAKTALTVDEADEDRVSFQRTSLRQLIDSPVAMGRYTVTTRLTEEGDPVPHYLHVIAATDSGTRIPASVLAGYRKLVREAGALFGHHPFQDYHFLLIVDDRLEETGLEHLRSSLNVVRARNLFSSSRRIGWTVELLPHEYVHAWCGKYRRPQGMVRANYNDDKQLNLLWIYEGLTEYLGCVLTARSGLMTHSDFRQALAGRVHEMRMQKGRDWQSLEDTAVTSFLRRDSSRYWAYLRRDQDYYEEGSHYWMEADAEIRRLTQGEKSLDDFCRVFLGRESELRILSYGEDDVYNALSAVAEHDWKAFFHHRVKRMVSELSLAPLEKVGYRLDYVSSRSRYQNTEEFIYGLIDETQAIGFILGNDGEIEWFVPDTPADKARLAEGDVVAFVDGDAYTRTVFHDALKNKRGPSTL